MEEQENNEKDLEREVEEAGKRKIEQTAKDFTRKASKQAGKVIADLAKKAFVSIILPNLPWILAICIILVFTMGSVYVVKDEIAKIGDAASDSMISFVTIGDNGPEIASKTEMIEAIDEQLENIGVKKEDLQMGNDSQASNYLYEYMLASLSTQLPYIEGNESKGIVKIKRCSDDGNTRNLTFIKHEDLQKLIEENDTSALNYFSIDDSWQLCIAKYTRTTVTSSNGEKTVTDIVTEVKIPYQTMISQYTVPFNFLLILQQISLNPEYVSAVADLIEEQGEIELTIFDSKEVRTTEYTYQYDLHKRWVEEVLVEVPVENEDNGNNENSEDSESNEIVKPGSNSGNKPGGGGMIPTTRAKVNVQQTDTGSSGGSSSNSDSETETTPKIELIHRIELVQRTEDTHVTETTITVNEINTIKANITKAKVWVIDQLTGYTLNNSTEYPLGEDGLTTDLGSEEIPEDATEGEWKLNQTEHTKETVVKNEWQVANTDTNVNPSKFLGLWRNSTGLYSKNADYVAKPLGQLVKYTKPPTHLTLESPLDNILSSEEMLYQLLENSETTQTHAIIMKELIEFYKTGDEIELDLSIFNPREFTQSSYTGGFDVHDESLFITDVDILKKALASGYSNSGKLVSNAQAFLDMQNKYKVNALFGAAVSIIETSAGTRGNAVNGCNNWFNITGKNGAYKTTTNSKGETYNWRIYSSDAEGIEAFGNLIANGNYYYRQGKYTVGDIGAVYCPNTVNHPTQADDWTANVTAQINKFYQAVGMDISAYITSGGGITAAGGEGYRGIYTTASGKSYVEYLQYSGMWASKPYAGGTMKSSGCSVTSVAVILSGYGIDKNPDDIRPSNGSMISITEVLQAHGLTATRINTPSSTQVLQHLNKGDSVIIRAGGRQAGYSGMWSNGSGHYFAVLEAKGNKVYVSNVGSSTKTGWYDINTVLKDNIQVIFVSR